jgi:hypothetical protein
MATCSHCGRDTIQPIRKWWSDSAAPTTCPECGGLSRVSTSGAILVDGTGAVLLVVSFGLAGLLAAPWILVAGLLSIFATYSVWWRRLPMVPTTADEVAATRWWGWGVVFLFIALVAVAAYW